jgi:AcrR family transcriptional regulator
MTEKKTKIGRRRAANAKESSEFYQERRKEIFDTAALVFEERGYQATTIADIAQKLGTDRASLYYYVGSKKELFHQVVREAAQTNVLAIEALANSKQPARDKLRLAYMRLMESYSTSYPYLHLFLQEKFPTLSGERDAWSKEAKEWNDRYYRGMRKIIKQGIDDGEFSIGLPAGLATMAVIGAINWAHRWYRPGGKLPPEEIGKGFAEILLHGIAARQGRK